MCLDQKKIGILGAGQLSLMLAEAAESLGRSCYVFASSKNDPALTRFHSGQVGQLQNERDFEAFLAEVGPIIFESDFLPFENLRRFSSAQFVPSLQLIERISDKIEQKSILKEVQIPVPNFSVLQEGAAIESWIESLAKQYPSGYVLKWARGGYDGKGVWISKSADAGSAPDFIREGLRRGTQVFAEELIDFKREISKVCVYSVTGEFRTYPLVISKQTRGICDYAYGPATEFGVSASLELEIDRLLKNFAEKFHFYGVFAVELFETKDGRFVANEIAPRVHNTGHFSLSVCEASQFENHIRAVLGLPLGSTSAKKNFLMKNILGSLTANNVSSPKASVPSWDLKWYDKKEMRPGRKMGHINCSGFDKSKLNEVLAELESWIHRWAAGLEPKDKGSSDD